MIKRPEYIKPGDAIGVTAPSFGPSIEPYSLMYPLSKENIESRGYKVIAGETVFKNDGLGISTDPKVTGKELMDFYKREDINAIISAGGGELMCETISNMDFDELKAYKPKWFIGYSDNTNFIFPLVTITGVQGIYGPCINGYAKKWEETEFDSFALLEGTKSSFDGYKKFVNPEKEEPEPEQYTDEYLRAPYSFNDDRELIIYKNKDGEAIKTDDKVKMKGMLLGGCLDILVNICGTRFDRMKDFIRENGDIIWVIEACDLTPMAIRRSLWNLREAGWFDSAAGFIIGRPLNSWKQNMMGVDQYNAVTDILAPLGKDIIMDAEIGHVDPMLPVVMGAEAEVSADSVDLNIRYV